SSVCFVLMSPRPPRLTLFPYTTLFRSLARGPRSTRRGPCLYRRQQCPSARATAAPQASRVATRVSSTAHHGVPFGNGSRSRSTRSEEHTSELQSRGHLVCRLLLEKKKQ